MVCVVDILMEEGVCELYVNLGIFVRHQAMKPVFRMAVNLLATDTLEVKINVVPLDRINLLDGTPKTFWPRAIFQCT